ncbi:MAG: A/G-specific adenine glycosylase [Flavobacteriaceae bacterium]|nr:A/G-specific adenine glycosylase [Flavobacteriaceae bacterium]
MKFSRRITNWYSVNKRSLPWRESQNPYQIWLSEIIMQQTQINQGLPYYQKFSQKYPTIFDLANASETEILKLWQGLGYYSRARNLHQTAKHIVNKFNGEFPKTFDELIRLKGVGDYTASAIASICYDAPTATVDGNVYRVLSRYFGIKTPINSTKGIREFKALAQRLLPKSNIGDHNQGLMEFGSKQCKPKSPDCTSCPLNDSCVAVQKNIVDQLPVKINKTKIKRRYFNYLVFLSKGKRTILKQRRSNGIWQNLYEFPLIETKTPVSVEDIKNHNDLRNLCEQKEFQLNLFNEKSIVHKLSHQHLYTKFWIVNVDRLPQDAIQVTDLDSYPVPVLIANFIDSFNF